jgi:hypothetical protein
MSSCYFRAIPGPEQQGQWRYGLVNTDRMHICVLEWVHRSAWPGVNSSRGEEVDMTADAWGILAYINLSLELIPELFLSAF